MPLQVCAVCTNGHTALHLFVFNKHIFADVFTSEHIEQICSFSWLQNDGVAVHELCKQFLVDRHLNCFHFLVTNTAEGVSLDECL